MRTFVWDAEQIIITLFTKQRTAFFQLVDNSVMIMYLHFEQWTVQELSHKTLI